MKTKWKWRRSWGFERDSRRVEGTTEGDRVGVIGQADDRRVKAGVVGEVEGRKGGGGWEGIVEKVKGINGRTAKDGYGQ